MSVGDLSGGSNDTSTMRGRRRFSAVDTTTREGGDDSCDESRERSRLPSPVRCESGGESPRRSEVSVSASIEQKWRMPIINYWRLCLSRNIRRYVSHDNSSVYRCVTRGVVVGVGVGGSGSGSVEVGDGWGLGGEVNTGVGGDGNGRGGCMLLLSKTQAHVVHADRIFHGAARLPFTTRTRARHPLRAYVATAFPSLLHATKMKLILPSL